MRSQSRAGRAALASLAAAALLAAGACGGDDRGGTADGEAAAGEVAALDYEVTPERYQQWVAAQQSLDAISGLPAPPKIDPMRLDAAQIDRAVQYLEGDPRARAALARAGIGARDYVLTTIALDQALVTASAGGAVPASGDPGATGPSAAAPAAGPPSASSTTRGGARPSAASSPAATASRARVAAAAARPRARLTGTPQRNVELVRRNRADVVRVLRTMRFRISEPAAEDVADTVGEPDSVTRSDSVRVGKDVTVKWDVTVRRNRDTATARTTPRDSTRPDTSRPDSSNR